MTSLAAIRRLHEHRAWANDRLLAAALTLTFEQLHQPCAIGQGSVWRSLVHMYAAEYVWLAALQGHPDPVAPGDLPGRLPGNQQGEHPIASLSELTERYSALHADWRSYLAGVEPPALSELVRKRSTSSHGGKRPAITRLDVLLHVCTHAHYTAAQTVNMLRQVGASALPDLMLITLARDEASEEQG